MEGGGGGLGQGGQREFGLSETGVQGSGGFVSFEIVQLRTRILGNPPTQLPGWGQRSPGGDRLWMGQSSPHLSLCRLQEV